jgi:hypothetical protein
MIGDGDAFHPIATGALAAMALGSEEFHEEPHIALQRRNTLA